LSRLKSDGVWRFRDGQLVPSDQAIWYEDFLNFFDWEAVKKSVETEYGEKPLATWWMQATPGVNYYRAELPARHLPGKTLRLETWDLQEQVEKLGGDNGPTLSFPNQRGDTAIWMFPGNKAKAVLMAEMRLQGYRVLVEVDDNYTVPPSTPGLSEWVNKPDGKGSSSYQTHTRIVQRFCDGMIVSTPALARAYEHLTENIYVCPNQVDPDDWVAPFYGGRKELAPAAESDILRIGWAGSDSHRYDVADIAPALDWASRQKGVEVVVLGSLRVIPSCWQVPWADSLAEYRRNVGFLDVMLCPLRPNAWADCKSDVKALEAAMGGACSIVSKTEPYRPWWDSDAPCLVAEGKKGFLAAVKRLVRDPDGTKEMGQKARKWVLANRTIQKNIGAWRDAL